MVSFGQFLIFEFTHAKETTHKHLHALLLDSVTVEKLSYGTKLLYDFVQQIFLQDLSHSFVNSFDLFVKFLVSLLGF